jgi:hypothetical protein
MTGDLGVAWDLQIDTKEPLTARPAHTDQLFGIDLAVFELGRQAAQIEPYRRLGARLSSGPRAAGGPVIAQRTIGPTACLCSAALGMTNYYAADRAASRVTVLPMTVPGALRRSGLD